MPKPRPRMTPVGVRIRRAREEHDWTQVELARRADVPPSYINKVEAGAIQMPSGEYLGKLAAVLGWTTDALLYGQPDPASDDDLIERLRLALGTDKGHLLEPTLEALRKLPPDERDQAIEVIHRLAVNWPARPRRA